MPLDALDALYVNLTKDTYNNVCGYDIPRCTKYEDLPYEYIEPHVLGTGSYGKVSVYKKKYKNTNNIPQELFCIKEIKLTDSILSDKDNLCEIIKEYFILNYIACENPYVLCFIECVLNEEYMWLITTYESGAIDLFEYIRTIKPGGFLSYLRIIDICDQLIQGLMFLHSKEIYHLDIKAENIIYNTNTKTVKYIDFGLSCIKQYKCIIGGTITYCPPEIMLLRLGKNVFEEGRQHKIIYTTIMYDKCDIYSLGVTLYYLISKTYPRDIIENSYTTIYGSIKPLHCKKELESLAKIIMNMISMNPNDRPPLNTINETIKSLKLIHK